MGLCDQFSDPGGNPAQGAGHEAGPGLRQGMPLVCFHADTEHGGTGARSGGDLPQGFVAGVAAGGKDHVGVLSQHPTRDGGTPLRIVEGEQRVARMVGCDHADVGGDVTGSQCESFSERHNRRHGIGAQDGGHRTGLGQPGGQHSGQEPGLILPEYQTRQVGQHFGLKLVDADEVDAGMPAGGGHGCFTQGEADRHDHVVSAVDELFDVAGVVLGIGGLDVAEVRVRGQSQRVGSGQAPCPGGLIEAAVVNPADIRDQANPEQCIPRLHVCRGHDRIDRASGQQQDRGQWGEPAPPPGNKRPCKPAHRRWLRRGSGRAYCPYSVSRVPSSKAACTVSRACCSSGPTAAAWSWKSARPMSPTWLPAGKVPSWAAMIS